MATREADNKVHYTVAATIVLADSSLAKNMGLTNKYKIQNYFIIFTQYFLSSMTEGTVQIVNVLVLPIVFFPAGMLEKFGRKFLGEDFEDFEKKCKENY